MKALKYFLALLAISSLSSSRAQWLDTLDFNDQFPNSLDYTGSSALLKLVNDSLIITNIAFGGHQNIASQWPYVVYHNSNGQRIGFTEVPFLGNIQYKPSRMHSLFYSKYGYIIRTADAFPPNEPSISGFIPYFSGDSVSWTKTGYIKFFSDVSPYHGAQVWIVSPLSDSVYYKINLETGVVYDTIPESTIIAQAFPNVNSSYNNLYLTEQKDDTLYVLAEERSSANR